MNKSEILQIAKPILFNAKMVCAILDGKKTVTRRIIKPQPLSKIATGYCYDSTLENDKYIGCFIFGDDYGDAKEWVKSKYKQNDILYVRETWAEYDRFYYKATEPDAAEPIENNDVRWFKWRPSIHMPKEAARIFLRVIDVRAEKLQDITDEQAKSEGVCGLCYDAETGEEKYDMTWFKLFWDSTLPKNPNKFKCPENSWESNPWVWVIEFEPLAVTT